MEEGRVQGQPSSLLLQISGSLLTQWQVKTYGNEWKALGYQHTWKQYVLHLKHYPRQECATSNIVLLDRFPHPMSSSSIILSTLNILLIKHSTPLTFPHPTFSSSNLSFSKTRLLQRPDRNRIISWLYKPNAPHQCNSVRQDSNLATMELKALYLPSGQLLRTIRFLICKYQAWIHNKKPLRQTTWY